MAETWLLNESIDAPNNEHTWNANFISNGIAYTKLTWSDAPRQVLKYDSTVVYKEAPLHSWLDQAYRTISFDVAPTSDLLTFLQANGVKQIKPANKVVVNGETILDLTQDTVTSDKMVSGVTAHDKSGKQITGSMEEVDHFDLGGGIPFAVGRSFAFPSLSVGSAGGLIGGYVNQGVKYNVLVVKSFFGDATSGDVLKGKLYSSANGLSTIGTMPNNGAAAIQLSDLTAKSVTAGYYSGGTAKVADAEAAKIIPENIKKGVTILGVEGTMEEGGPYNIAATTNSDGTQNLAITDAAGGGSGSGGRPPVSLTITVDPTRAPEKWSLDVYGPSGSLFTFDANNPTFTIPDCTAGDMFVVVNNSMKQSTISGYLDKDYTECVNCYFDITSFAPDYVGSISALCLYACQIDTDLSAGAEATMTLKFN